MFAEEESKRQLFFGSPVIEVRHVSGMFTDRDIASLRECVARSTSSGTAEHVPSPAAVAGASAGHSVAGGITGH
jgi:hypothetical protein